MWTVSQGKNEKYLPSAFRDWLRADLECRARSRLNSPRCFRCDRYIWQMLNVWEGEGGEADSGF